jgi:UDP-N-acetyl-D-glucosamine dehydrogenase
VAYHDPFCPVIVDDGHTPLQGLPMHSIPLSEANARAADCCVVVTDHSVVNYPWLTRSARLVVDTRGCVRPVAGGARVVGLSDVSEEARRVEATATMVVV